MKSKAFMKGTTDIQRVNTPARQRWSASRKRALRSGSVRAARSVCSEHQSRVFELRNSLSDGAFLFNLGGAAIRCAQMGSALGTVRSPGAGQRCMGISWEPVRACPSLLNTTRTRAIPREQCLGSGLISRAWTSETGENSKVPRVKSEARFAGRGNAGRLSCLIVAFENRVTPLGRSR